MKTFTANQMHEKRTDVYKAAMKGPVRITHGHLKEDFILTLESDYAIETAATDTEMMSLIEVGDSDE